MRCFQFFILIVFGIWYSVPSICGLRLTGVNVPAFRKKGETALLECKYELKKLHHFKMHQRGLDDIAGGGQEEIAEEEPDHEATEDSEDEEHDIATGESEEVLEEHQRHRTRKEQQRLASRRRGHRREAEEEDKQQFRGGTGKFYETSEALYSVKWYKDNEEFYRYLPKSNPPQHSYRVEGIRVDHQYSDSTKVTLRGLTVKSSGVYRCEVSAEAPSFHSVQAEGRMIIVQLPKEGPKISGEGNQYQIGDLLSLNCTSGRSHPASVLHWYINDKLVINPDTLMRYPHTHYPQGLITTTLGLEMDIEAHHFHDGQMRVKCVASVSPVLWQGDKENVFRRRMLEHQETMLLVRNRASAVGVSLLQLLVSLLSLIPHCLAH